MRVGAFEIDEPVPELEGPHVLAILRPWVDVSSAGSLTLSRLESDFAGKEFARLQRPGEFFDFTRYRPVIYIKEGRREVQVPNTSVSYGKREGGHDFLFLRVLEPHMLAEIYIGSILQLFKTFDVKRYCLLGAMYDMVPHTRPLLVSGAASDLGLQNELTAAGVTPSEYEGPTTILYTMSQQLAEMGIETLSLIVHLPQYLTMAEDFRGEVRLMQVLGALYDFPLSQQDINRAKEQEYQVDQIAEQIMQQEPRYRHILSQLEDNYDTRVGAKSGDIKLPPDVERFLQDLGRRFGQN